MRVCKKDLTELTAKLNQAYTGSTKFDLDHAACYGGYCLTTHEGSHHVTSRMPAKEMYAYLLGALEFIDLYNLNLMGDK